MATGVEVGTAYVNVVSSTKGFGKNISKSLNSVGKNAGKQGTEAGQRLINNAGTAIRGAAAGIGLAAGAAIGAAIIGGVKSAVNQQTAERVLGGLYGSASKATKMMDDLRAVSSSSPIQYSAYTRAAEALAYAGVEGDQAVSVLENVGHAITATGGTAEHMDRATSAVTKMVNAGKVSLDSLQELSGSGVPIISGLADHFGASMEDINKMASEGSIGLEDVVTVMEDAVGPSFQKSLAGSEAAAGSFGNQMKIVSDNIMTAIGAELKPVLDELGPVITDIGQKAVEAIPGIMEAIRGVVGWMQKWGPLFLPIIAALGAYAAVIGVIRVATTLWSAATVILNAVMNANPIARIVALIAGLVAAFILAYNRVGWFRDLVDTAWAAIKVAISAVVDWFTGTAWPFMKTILDALGAAFMWLWQSVIVPAWNGIWGAIQAAWGFIKPIFDFIVNAIVNYLVVYFQVLWTFIQVAWKGIQIAIQIAWNIIKVIFNAIVGFVNNVLAPVFQWFWNWVIKPVWSGIQLAIQLAWGAIKIIFAAIKWYIDNVLAPVFRWLWNNVIKPVWDGIKSTINTIWVFIRDKIFTPIKAFMENVLGPAFQWLYDNVITPVWDGIKSTINTVWKFVRDKIFDPMKTAVSETVPDAFEAGKDAIAEAWDKIKDVAKKPVKFVIDTVINKGIIDNFNQIADIFDVDKIDHVSLPDGFARGGHTGPGSKYKPAGIVHADEFVVQKSSRRRFERDNPGALDHLNRTGRLPAYGGYASGGRVGGSLIDAANWWIAKGARGSRHPAFGGAVRSGHSNGSLHYQDRAVDLNYGPGGQNATEMSFFDRYVSEFKSLFPGIRTIWRAPGHYNHLHIDTSNGADIGDFSGASSGGGLLNILNPFQGLFDKIKSGITSDGMFGDLVAGGAKKMVQAPIDWIKDKASMIGDVFEGVQDAVGTGTTKARVRAVATARGWGVGQQWRDLSALIQQESSWDKNAANPSSSARGLFQKMTSLHGPLEKTVEGQAGWGLNYIKRTYGTPSAAWAFHKRNNWYAGGGHVAPTLYDKGGMLQPGTSLVANKTRKPEYILPARVTDALMDGRTGGNGIAIDRLVIEAGSEADGRSLARDFLGEIRRQQRGGVYVGA